MALGGDRLKLIANYGAGVDLIDVATARHAVATGQLDVAVAGGAEVVAPGMGTDEGDELHQVLRRHRRVDEENDVADGHNGNEESWEGDGL